MHYLTYELKDPGAAYPFYKWSPHHNADSSLTVIDFRGGHPWEYRVYLCLTNQAVYASDGYLYLGLDEKEIQAVRLTIATKRKLPVTRVTDGMVRAFLIRLVELVNMEFVRLSQPLQIPLYLTAVSSQTPDYESNLDDQRYVIVKARQPGVVHVPIRRRRPRRLAPSEVA